MKVYIVYNYNNYEVTSVVSGVYSTLEKAEAQLLACADSMWANEPEWFEQEWNELYEDEPQYQNYTGYLKRCLEQAFDDYGDHPYIEEWEVE